MLAGLRARLPAVAAAGAVLGGASLILTERSDAAARPSALDQQEWRALKLVNKQQLTKGANPTVLFRFEFPDKQQPAGLPVASCLLTRAPIGSIKDDGTQTMVIRPYTPISKPSEVGHLDLAIKVYPSGKMSQHLYHLKLGDTVDMKGPMMKLPLETIKQKPNIGMIAGGSGLTPMLQIIEEVVRERLPLKISFVFANVSESDIIAKDRLDALATSHPDQFSVFYVVDKASSANWKGGVGFITQDMLRAHIPPPSSDTLVLICGPPGMMKAISGDKNPDKTQGPLSGLLKDMGYNEDMVFKF